MRRRLIELAALFISLAGPAVAGDLNPPGPPASTVPLDEPRTPITALPLTISEPGSYFLTGNLSVADSIAISVEAEGVTIDLNGFTIRGNGAGNFDGIILGEQTGGVTIRNGYIIDFGGSGIVGFGSPHCRVSHVTALDNGSIGIIAGNQCIIEHCIGGRNGLSGINAGGNGSISHCVADNNGGSGIVANQGTAVINCTSSNNGDSGFVISTACTVSNSTAHDNGEHGFRVSGASALLNCASTANTLNGYTFSSGGTLQNSTASNNDLNGILIESNSNSILNSVCDFNGRDGYGAGIFADVNGFASRIDGNQLTNNDAGLDIRSTGNFIVRNSARSNSDGVGNTNYVIVPNNAHGAITNVADNFNVANPWANFSY